MKEYWRETEWAKTEILAKEQLGIARLAALETVNSYLSGGTLYLKPGAPL
jgi:hypothetical protein